MPSFATAKRSLGVFVYGISVVLWAVPSVTHAAIVQPNCKRTTANYSGNLGGLAGADAKCAAEYPNYRFARDVSFVFYAADDYAGGSAFMNSKLYAMDVAGGNCYAWTSTSGYMMDGFSLAQDEYDLTIGTGGSPYNYGKATRSLGGKRPQGPNGNIKAEANETCSATQPIWCCNF